jgi:hypothetical protein
VGSTSGDKASSGLKPMATRGEARRQEKGSLWQPDLMLWATSWPGRHMHHPV